MARALSFLKNKLQISGNKRFQRRWPILELEHPGSLGI